MTKTICALASASGKSGVAVIRVSGAQSAKVIETLTGRDLPKARRATVRRLYDDSTSSNANFIDESLVLWMPGPHSFTGEDIVEFHVHGGTAITDATIEACLDVENVRLAEPGEFTRRAFENQKLDLTQAEAIGDLIDAETDAQRAQALNQYEGRLSDIMEGWRTQLIQAMASLEASIDFPDEDDVPSGINTRAYSILKSLRSDLDKNLEESIVGLSTRDGYKIAIVGEPNAGKSSLLNIVSGREAAIVSDIPGTTRDIVEIRLTLGGHVVWLSDTAGLRETHDEIEAEGVKRALSRANDADTKILVIPSNAREIPDIQLSKDDIIVLNKSDLGSVSNIVQDFAARSQNEIIPVSVKHETGLSDVVNAIESRVIETHSNVPSPAITRRRHITLVEAARSSIDQALLALENNLGAELVSEDLRSAALDLGRVTGRVDVEDLLDNIFSEFCIGK